MDTFFVLFFVFVAVISVVFIIKSLSMFSSKGRAKMMNKLMDEAIETSKSILDEHEEDLKEISTRSAKIEEEAIKIKAKAVKDGLTKDE